MNSKSEMFNLVMNFLVMSFSWDRQGLMVRMMVELNPKYIADGGKKEINNNKYPLLETNCILD